jgi:menaquinone-specific isochorismate synthase
MSSTVPPPPADNWELAGSPALSPSPTYRSSADGRLIALSRRCDGLTVQSFLRQAVGRERFFWEDVRDGIIYAGCGLAVNLLAWGGDRFRHIHELARTLFADAVVPSDTPRLAAPRLFGGFSFRADFVPDNVWAAFHPAHFVLPHYQFVQQGAETWLTINALLAPDDDPAETLAQLSEALDLQETALRAGEAQPLSPAELPAARSVTFPMQFDAWREIIRDARGQIEAGRLKKVVLSRVCEARFAGRVDVDSALDYLGRWYADCYRFLFEPRPYHALFGATPELLARVDGATVSTMAMAGSIGRSDDPREDASLGQKLIHSAKDRREHEFVVVSLLQRLALATSGLDISPQPGLYRLHNIQHLYTPVRGKLIRPDGVLPVVELLHPTPAMGGSPRELAMAYIQRNEPFPRGWYAGPIGWIDQKLDGAFAVAIRSAVAQERRAWLYAGAGIVDESNAEREWQETALKFEPILNALGVERPRAELT